MAEFRFDNVRLVLGDKNRQVRHAVKSALYARGFRNLVDTGTFSHVQQAVAENQADLLICDVDFPEGDVCDLVHSARHHTIGNNPFLVVISLISDPTMDGVKRVIDSGADDVIVKPLAMDHLLHRIESLCRGRKPFAVTHDYIGPDRRKAPRPGEGQQLPLIEVPNPLRSKATGISDGLALQRMIDAAATRLNETKMERYAVQISFLIDRILGVYKEGKPAETLHADLSRLLYVGEDLGRRLRGTPYAHVSELAMSLVALTQRILANPGKPDHVDVELLPKLAQAVSRAFDPQSHTVRAAQAITQKLNSQFGKLHPENQAVALAG